MIKAVILAGGLGTRLSEITRLIPKPMAEIGNRPILWHIMKYYSCFGIKDFIICAGYKQSVIRDYFYNYKMHHSDISIDLSTGDITFLASQSEDWNVTIVDTGQATMTGGRLKRVEHLVKDEKFFHLTYGDGVADIDIHKLTSFHQSHGSLVTMSGVQSPGRFGALNLRDNKVTDFKEKPRGDGNYINGGFFVIDPLAIKYVEDDSTTWEQEPLQMLASSSQLQCFKHEGFWHPMDSLRDNTYLNKLWDENSAPWRIW